MRRAGRVENASGGLPPAAFRPADRPTIARQAGPSQAPDEIDLWSMPALPEIDCDDENCRPCRRREEPGLRWWTVVMRPFSPVDVALALSVVVLLVAMVVVAIALTSHV